MARRSKPGIARGGTPPANSPAASSQTADKSKPEQQARNHWLTLAVCLFLALAVGLVFGRTLNFGFINYDDDLYVYQNPVVTGGLNFHNIFWSFTHDSGLGAWFPLTDVSHMLDWQLYGAKAGGHHLTNLLLHAANSILLFLVLRRLTGRFWGAAFVAAIFAVHPLRVESVAWVTERKDVLSGLFFMLTLWAWARHVQAESKRRNPKQIALAERIRRCGTMDYFLAVFFFVLALLSKTTVVVLPLVLLLLDYWPLNRSPSAGSGAARTRLQIWAGLIGEKLPFLFLSAAACFITLATQKHVFNIPGVTVAWRFGDALLAYTDYLRHMIYPVGLALIYSPPPSHLPVGSVMLSGLILLAITICAIAGWRRRPYLLMGWLWYLGMMLPVIDMLQAGDQTRADRYTYLPQIGFSIALTWGAMELCCSCRRPRQLGLAAVGGVVFALLMAGAYAQTANWRDSVTLWNHTLTCTDKSNLVAQNNLGLALAEQGKLDEAVQHYDLALASYPDLAYLHNNLGNALAQQGKIPEAFQQLERAVQLSPGYAPAQVSLGFTLAGQGRLDEAIQHYEQALKIDPNYCDAYNDLGVALAAQKKPDEAIQNFNRALQINPNDAGVCYNLGNTLAEAGRTGEGITYYERALKINPDYAAVHCNLGNALADNGRSEEAIQQFQQALNLAIAQGDTNLAAFVRARLESYSPASPPGGTLVK